jgi:hypothetical protein
VKLQKSFLSWLFCDYLWPCLFLYFTSVLNSFTYICCCTVEQIIIRSTFALGEEDHFTNKFWKQLNTVCPNMENFTREKCSWPFLNLFYYISSKMIFLNFKKSFQSWGSEYFLRTDLEDFRHFLFYRVETNQNSWILTWKLNSNPKKPYVYIVFRQIPCWVFPKSLN